MTKLLYIPSGTYIMFNSIMRTDRTEIVEDSYWHNNHRDNAAYIIYKLVHSNADRYASLRKASDIPLNVKLQVEEFEIIDV